MSCETITVTVQPNSPTVTTIAKGDKGDKGDSGGDLTITSPGNFSGHRAVATNSGGLVYADASTIGHRNQFMGITTNAATTGQPLTIARGGEITESSWNWTPDQPIFLGLNGNLTQTLPVSSVFSLIIGVARTATKIFVAPREPITL